MEEFIKNLLVKAGFEEENGNDLLAEDIRAVLMDRIVSELAYKLGEEKTEKITEMIKNDEENSKILNYIKSHINDYDSFVSTIYQQFENEYLENFK